MRHHHPHFVTGLFRYIAWVGEPDVGHAIGAPMQQVGGVGPSGRVIRAADGVLDRAR
jgi:hypothetical protein